MAEMRKSRLSGEKQKRLVEHFVAGTIARTAASLVGVNKSTAACYFHRLREVIYQASEDLSPFDGEIEVDESYLEASARACEAAELPAKCLYLAC